MKGDAIATAQAIPVRFLESILAELRRSGIVGSQRGSDGGYWLARARRRGVGRRRDPGRRGTAGRRPRRPAGGGGLRGRGRRAPAGLDRHAGRPPGGPGGHDARRHRRRQPCPPSISSWPRAQTVGPAARRISTVVRPPRPLGPLHRSRVPMPRRIEIELTSSRDDGSWTWRAAGAKAPKGTVAGVAPARRAPRSATCSGSTPSSSWTASRSPASLPPKGSRQEPERLELLVPGQGGAAGHHHAHHARAARTGARGATGGRRDGGRAATARPP